jgi:hypothetical protein
VEEVPWRIIGGKIVYVPPEKEREAPEKPKKKGGNPHRGRVASTGPCGMGDDLELV